MGVVTGVIVLETMVGDTHHCLREIDETLDQWQIHDEIEDANEEE